ncbi:MAG: DNA cytosine methyltransferase [Nitrososphaerota archaeon]|nr:DNA cytosine methyltransferase [Nitrososphaerota archaeon]
MRRLTFVDVFAGAGGFSLGLHEAGLKGLFAVEKDAMAFDTLSSNLLRRGAFDWPRWLPRAPLAVEDLLRRHRDRLLRMRGSVDVVVGGPPCQGFSTAGRRREDDGRNSLFREYTKLVGTLAPRFMVFENVPGFAMRFRGSGRSYLEMLGEELRSLGYAGPAHAVVDFSSMGVPQCRKRLIVVSALEGVDPWRVLDRLVGGGHCPRVSVEEAISDLLRSYGEVPCPDSRGRFSGVYGPARSAYQRMMRKGWRERVPDSHRFARHDWKVEVGFAQALEAFRSGHGWQSWSRKKVFEPLCEACPAPTLTSLPDDHIHYSEPRILTVREYARLQSFPDWFVFRGKYTTGGRRRRTQVPRYTQVANAVPPIAARRIGEALSSVA